MVWTPVQFRPSPQFCRHYKLNKSSTTIQKRYRINQQIRLSPVRVVDDKGQVGVMPIEEALKIAQERGLDLIEIAPTAQPPVVKIADFGKFKYERERGEREHRSKQKDTETKMLRIGYATGSHDLEMRAHQAKDFLEEKNKVRIDMVLRGREKAHREFAKKRFQEFLALIPNHEIESPIKSTPQGFTVIIHGAN